MNKTVDCVIVEDSATQALQLEDLLEAHNYSVVTARNGIEALDLLNRVDASIVISDIVMPKMNGYELCRAIKSDERLQHVAVLLLTTLSDPEDIFQALECGADNFVTKPAAEDQILGRIQYLLANRQVRDEETIRAGLEVRFSGQRQFITSSRLQILNLLLSTYDVAVQKNRELIKAADDLQHLNDELEQKVAERTQHLEQEIDQRERAEGRLRRKHNVLQLLECAASAANESISPEEAFRTVVRRACELTGWPVGHIFVHEENVAQDLAYSGVWFTLSRDNGDAKTVARHAKDCIAETLVREVYASRHPIWVNDVGSMSPPGVAQSFNAFPVQTAVAAPIMVGPQVAGVIEFYHYDQVDQDDELVSALKHVGIHLGRMIERSRASKTLEDRELFLEAVINHSLALIYVKDLEGRFISINQRFEERFGVSKMDAQGKNDYEIFPPEVAERIHQNDRQILISGNSREFEEDIPANGEVYSYISLKFPLRDSSGRIYAVCGHLTDITERKRAEAERRRLVTAIEQSSDGVAVVDQNGAVLFANSAIRSMYAHGDAMHIQALEIGHDDSGNENLGQFWDHVRTDVRLHDEYRTFHRTIEPESDWDVRFSPIYEPGQPEPHYLLHMKNATEQRKLEAQVRRKQRMESIGTLASGIAHDFNNILSAVIGYAELCAVSMDDPKELCRHLDVIHTAGVRAKNLVQQILQFSNPLDGAYVPTKIDIVISEVLDLVRSTQPRSIEFKVIADDACREVMADPTQLHQVLMNLCTNACHSIGKASGRVTIRVEPYWIDDESKLVHPDQKVGEYVKISVTDTGHGMTKAIVERIFDPYFTTKGPKEGTGLGLATCHRIIRDHRGAMSVYSEPNKGSTFNMYLPIADQHQISETIVGVELPMEGSESIFVVDDEAVLAELVTRVLSRAGYSVTAFTSSIECLEAVRQAPNSFNLLISDTTMPDMTGDELARAMYVSCPEVPVIIVSGFLGGDGEKTLPNVKASLMKPVGSKDLLRIVRRTLNEHSARHRG